MQTEIFTLCDAATVSGGKMNLLGSFDTIHAAEFPYKHPICAVATKLRFDLGEEGEHEFEISLSDPDMHPILNPIKQKIVIQIPDRSQTHHHIWNILGFDMHSPGEYYFELKVDGDIKSRFPMYVKKLERN